MRIERLGQPGVLLFIPDVHKDHRGYFTETFNPHYGFKVIQVNQLFSRKGTVRGLHYQVPATRKLVWVSQGSILDVAFNLATGEYITHKLTAESHECLLVPKGFAHGFQALEDSTVHYLMDVPFAPNGDFGINPSIIKWPVKPIFMSDRDQKAPTYEDKFFSQ